MCGLPGGIGRATLKRLPIWPCSGRGLPCPGTSRPRRWALTPPFHPCPHPPPQKGRRPLAVYSLWHFPGVTPSRVSPSGLPCGVRTFLRGGLPCDPPAISPTAGLPAYTDNAGTPKLYRLRNAPGAGAGHSADKSAALKGKERKGQVLQKG